MVYWNITEVNKPCISGCFHISQFLSQGQYYLSWEGVPKLVLFIGIMVIQLVFLRVLLLEKGLVVLKIKILPARCLPQMSKCLFCFDS